MSDKANQEKLKDLPDEKSAAKSETASSPEKDSRKNSASVNTAASKRDDSRKKSQSGSAPSSPRRASQPKGNEAGKPATKEKCDQPKGKDLDLTIVGKAIKDPPPGPDQGFFLLQGNTGGPPKVITLEQMIDSSKLMTNMTLAHEIAVNSDFQINVRRRSSLSDPIEGVMKQAMWDAIREKLNSNPPDYTLALILLAEIKENLMGCLLPTNVKVKQSIEEVLDMNLIEQKVLNQAFVLTDCSKFVVSTMKQLCAPCRDEEIQALEKLTDPIDLFKGILETLDNMHLDMANFTISQIRPLIRNQSVQYEKEKFGEFLKQQEDMGVDGLEYTKYWIQRSSKNLEKEEKFGTSVKSLDRSPAALLQGAYMELLQWTDEEFPETCFMDEERFLLCGYKLRQLALTSSIIYLVSSFLKLSLPEAELSKSSLLGEIVILLQEVPEVEYPEKLQNLAEHIIRDVTGQSSSPLRDTKAAEAARKDSTPPAVPDRPGSASPPPKMPARAVSESNPGLSQLRSAVIGLWPDHVVYKSILKRLLTFVFESIQATKVDAAKLPKGVTTAGAAQLKLLAEQFLKLISHNRAVFGQWYSGILKPYFDASGPSPHRP